MRDVADDLGWGDAFEDSDASDAGAESDASASDDDGRTATATTTTTRDDAACAKCWGVSASNAYLNLASARGVVMIRGDSRASPPTTALARALLGGRGDAGTIPGGVLLTPTVHEDARKVSVEDAEFIAQALRAHDARLRDVPFGWWDGPLAESWRAPPEDDDETERAKPAAAKVARARLASFLEQTQGALNTFG